MGELYSGNFPDYSLEIADYCASVVRLITGLYDLSDNKSSYDDYEGAIEILLSSVAKAINSQIASEKEQKAKREAAAKNISNMPKPHRGGVSGN